MAGVSRRVRAPAARTLHRPSGGLAPPRGWGWRIGAYPPGALAERGWREARDGWGRAAARRFL